MSSYPRQEAEHLVRTWLHDWDGKGLGNFIPEDEQMVDLRQRIERALEDIYAIGVEED